MYVFYDVCYMMGVSHGNRHVLHATARLKQLCLRLHKRTKAVPRSVSVIWWNRCMLCADLAASLKLLCLRLHKRIRVGT